MRTYPEPVLICFLALLFLSAASARAEGQGTDILCKTVSAAYRPGVDVHGNPVVPADLSPPLKALPDVIKIPVTLDLAGDGAGVELKPETLGMAEIYSDGRVVYNGQDISAQAADLCGLPPVPTTVPDKAPAVLAPAEGTVIWGEGN